MAHNLTELVVDEISLVDKAAVRRKFLLLKRDDEGDPAMPDPNQLTLECSDSVAALFKAAAEAAGKAADGSAVSEALKAAIAHYQTVDADGWLEMSKIFSPAPKEPEKPAEPPMPEEVRKALEERDATIAIFQKRLDEEVERNRTITFVNLAKSDYAALPGTPEEVGDMLKRVSGDEFVMKLLKAANVAFTSLTKPIGQDVTHDMESQSAVTQLEKHAETIAARDGITQEKAFVKALSEYPDLARREREDRQAKRFAA